MPRRSRHQRRQRIVYSESQRLQLETGIDFFEDAWGNGDQFDARAAAVAWSRLREEMLVAHVAEHPCTRPWAWWRFEELPPRATVRPKARDIPPEPSRPYPWDRPCPSWEAMRRGEWFEAQAEYLRRHGLLTRSEALYLKAHPELLAPVPAIESHRR